MKRLLDKEYRRYVLRAQMFGHIVLPYVEYRKEYLLHNKLPDARIEAFKEAAKEQRDAQAERTFMRKLAGLSPKRLSKLDVELIRKTKEREDVENENQ